MKVFYELTTKKSFSEYDLNDEVMISVRYRYSGKRLNTSTGVSVKIKDWDKSWRNRVSKEPILKSDSDWGSTTNDIWLEIKNGNNQSGFNAFPAGIRRVEYDF